MARKRFRSTTVDWSTVKPLTPVRIHWIDAHHVATHWSREWPTDTCRVVSCGLFVEATDQQVLYAADAYADDDDVVLNGIGAIPLGCITKVEIWAADSGR